MLFVGNSALFWASWKGHADCVELLLSAGANPNLKDKLYETPLHAASRNGHVAIVQMLLSSHGHPETTNIEGTVCSVYK